MKLLKSIFFLIILVAIVTLWGLFRHPLATANMLPFLPNIEKMPLSQEIPLTVEKGTTKLLVAKDQTYVPIEEIPLPMRQAVIAIEDQRFTQHRGIDLRGVARAVFTNLIKQDMVEGASTITQQLARNLYLNQSQTVERKLTEMLLALQLEDYFHDKDKILELYINNVYYGRNAYGVQNAAKAYLGKTDVSSLNTSECALLASLPQSPSYFASNTDAALNRQKTVIQKMKELGYLNKDFKNSVPVIKRWDSSTPVTNTL